MPRCVSSRVAYIVDSAWLNFAGFIGIEDFCVSPPVIHAWIGRSADGLQNFVCDFFLFHLDLRSINVIFNRNWQLEAILHWEFASALAIEPVSPQCIMDRHHVNEIYTNSDNYMLYKSFVANIYRKIQNPSYRRSYTHLSDLVPTILSHLGDALSDG